MQAVVLESYGDPDVLTCREVPDPVPGPEEVRVALTGTSVNRADLLQRRGLYPGPPMDHEIPGLEFAGRIDQVGARVTAWRPGDEVMGIVAGGAYAQRLTVHERQVLRVPPAIGLDAAAAVPEVWITAWDALVLQGGFTSGRTALVHAGASGVGTAAIQVVVALGGRVITTASGPKCGRCLELGAEVAVDYRRDDFVAAARDLTGGRGVDVVLDVVGGDYVDRNVQALAVGGTIVQVGVMAGGTATVSVGALLPKRATLVGTVLRARPLEEKIAVTRRFEREVVPLFESDRLHPVIDRRFPLGEIAEAHRRMEANENVGKIVIDVPPVG